jgi:NitT/TauT family transport system substrate-binding protein
MVLRIMPHGRLHEWVADQEGYFAAEGLEYTFVQTGDYGVGPQQRDSGGEIKTGALETFESGRDGANVSCACHWVTSAAATGGAGKLITSAYSVAPCAILVAPESPVRRPEDLAGVPVGVGYHSGSHFAALQALESAMAPDQVTLTFQGPPNERLDALLDRQVPAAAMWGVPLYIAEAMGFRKVLDATFMIGFLVTGGDVSATDVERYLAALRRAQMAIDLHPERYRQHHLKAVPDKYRQRVDVRTFGTGERIVFLPYTGEVFAATQQWTLAHGLFPEPAPDSGTYDEVTVPG